MKPVVNTSVSDIKNLKNPKTASFLGKLGHLRSTAMAVAAALGLASSAEASVANIIAGAPNSTVSTAAVLPSSVVDCQEVANLFGDKPGASSFNIVVASPEIPNGLSGTYGSTFQVILPAGDVGTYGGVLTVSGYYGGWADKGGANLTNDFNTRFAYKINGGLETNLLTFDGVPYVNDITRDILPNITNPNAFFTKQITLLPGARTIDFFNYADVVFIRRSNTHLFGNLNDSTSSLNYSYVKNNTAPDTNLNAISDIWEINNFGALVQADGDPDKDGMNNLMEYALNTDPTKSNISPLTYTFETKNGEKYLSMAVTKNPDVTTLNYTAEVSSNLTQWSPAIEVVIDATHSRFEDTLPVSQSTQRFIRLNIKSK